MLNTAAYADLQNFVKTRIGSAEYKIGNNWYSAAIVEKVVMDDGTVRIKCQVSPNQACTITAVRVKNTDGDPWATKEVNVVIESSATHLLQWFDFLFSEKEVN